MSSSKEQIGLCDQYGVQPDIPADKDKLVIALDTLDQEPLNGLRHQPEADSSGWYVWGGIEFPSADDAFSPLHVSHMKDYCPSAIKFLGLPTGWRFLTDSDRSGAWEEGSPKYPLKAPGRIQRLLWGIAVLVVGLPILGLAIWGATNPADKSFSISIWATLFVVGLIGAFLATTGLRLVFDKPRKDGSLLHPVVLGFLGLTFMTLALFLTYAVIWSAQFATNRENLFVPIIFCFSIAGMCFYAARKKIRDRTAVKP